MRRIEHHHMITGMTARLLRQRQRQLQPPRPQGDGTTVQTPSNRSHQVRVTSQVIAHYSGQQLQMPYPCWIPARKPRQVDRVQRYPWGHGVRALTLPTASTPPRYISPSMFNLDTVANTTLFIESLNANHVTSCGFTILLGETKKTVSSLYNSCVVAMQTALDINMMYVLCYYFFVNCNNISVYLFIT